MLNTTTLAHRVTGTSFPSGRPCAGCVASLSLPLSLPIGCLA
ncbi:MAG: hypothetical protein V4754_21160 [Pseudomonadota bacterium]